MSFRLGHSYEMSNVIEYLIMSRVRCSVNSLNIETAFLLYSSSLKASHFAHKRTRNNLASCRQDDEPVPDFPGPSHYFILEEENRNQDYQFLPEGQSSLPFSQVSAAPITIAHGVHPVARSTAQTAFKLIRSRDQSVLPMHKVPAAGRSA